MRSGSAAPRILALAVAAATVAACARQGAPGGGIQDRRPPLVISVEPDTFARVQPGLDQLKVEFNERISERTSGGDLASAVIISPEVPEMEVSHGRSSLEIKVRGGLQPGRVYTIRILPEIQDMFGNPMAVPFEWSISTGGEFNPNAVVGQIWDRSTGDFLEGVRVVLTPDDSGAGTSADYAVVSGEDGLYALRVLPPGPFRLVAYQDVNRDRVLDGNEPVGSVRDSLGAADTVFLSVPVLLPDTTPAVLAQAEVLDSTVVRLVFDEYLDPTVPLDTVLVWLDPDTVAAEGADPVTGAPVVPVADENLPAPLRLFHEYQWTAFRDSIRAARDSLLQRAVDAALAAGDTARADSLQAAGIEPPPGGEGGRPGPGGDGPELLPDGTPVPEPSLVVRLDRPLPVRAPLRINVFGAVNLNGWATGGGAVPMIWDPAPPDTLQADSAVIGDSAAVPDTGSVPRPLRR